MEFALRLAIREMSRNRARLAVACLISLILFLSAFILINISYSLPQNFYRYYEEYFPSDLYIEVKNADKNLIDNSSKYFESIEIRHSFIKDRFILKNGNNSFDYVENTQSVRHKYVSEYTSVAIPDALGDNEEFVLAGELWNGESAESDIWISDIAANALFGDDITPDNYIGKRILLELDIHDNDKYDSKSYYTVRGVYDYAIYLDYLSNPPVFYMTDAAAIDIYLDNFDAYRIIGKVYNVSGLYDAYNSIVQKYEVEDSVQVDMLLAVKNAEAISAIIGVCMLIGGLVVLMNFISMFISTNRKNIGLMMALGARKYSITIGYGIIYAIMLSVIALITLIIIPTVNVLMSDFILYIGYQFEITTNYWLLLGLYGISVAGMVLIMLYENFRIKKLTPNHVLKEED